MAQPSKNDGSQPEMSQEDLERLAQDEISKLSEPAAPKQEAAPLTLDEPADPNERGSFETLDTLSFSPSATAESAPTKASVLSLVDVAKSYFKGNLEIPVLDGLDLEVEQGSFEALMGPSGSGKSTLLNLIAGLDRPTAGAIRVAGSDLGSMSEKQLSQWRAHTVGFIFQQYNLIPVMTAVQNVELPLLLRKSLSAKERRRRAELALKIVGLGERKNNLPRELSGGQEQRVAIARAIVTDPQILIADEPTGDLDRANADAILDLLVRLNKEFGKTIFMVTHDPEAAERADRQRRLRKGRLERA